MEYEHVSNEPRIVLINSGLVTTSSISLMKAFEHLGALWQYAMDQALLPEGKFYHPMRSLFMLDADFNQHHKDVIYKRVRKEPSIDNAHKVVFALSNTLSIRARHCCIARQSIISFARAVYGKTFRVI